MKKLIYIIFYIFSISCGKYNEKIENALRLAGNNRGELEKVLQHYSQAPTDSLKLKAAEFLIENMPGHYTLESPSINASRKKIYSDTTASYYPKKSLDISLSLVEQASIEANKKEDVKNIKADFLIQHIDRSFENLNTYAWLEDIPFDLFLEYILPYRFTNEPLDLWIDSLHISPNALKELALKDDIRNTLTRIKYDLKFVETTTLFPSNFIQKLFNQYIYDDCRHITLQENFRSRTLCIPASIDFILYYANRNGYHYWDNIVSPEFKKPEVRGALERKTAKVYRKTYSRHPTIKSDDAEFIPEFFKDPFHLDVSNEYLHTTNISVNIPKQLYGNPRYAYLCVFNNLKWNPIAIGNIKRSSAKFNDMGKNLVYLPGYYRGKKISSLNYPFILNLKGEVKHLIPDTNNRQKLLLTRKYPSNRNLYYYNIALAKIFVEATNRVSFHDADTILHSLSSTKTYCEGKINSCKKYRYWRISHPKSFTLAELSFYDSRGTLIQGQFDSIYITAFDKDPLTNAYIRDKEAITIDFYKPVDISRIVCIPQSDGNGIYPNNEYELFYHDLNGWRSLGRKIATDYHLEYDNVPSGALYWLHNRTTGIEERIFTYEKGSIRFW